MSEQAIAFLEKAARHLMVAKYITSCVGTLVVWEYFLILDDEVAYVWREKKTWVSCLFLVNRYLLLIYTAFTQYVNGDYQRALCERNVRVTSILAMFFLVTSDVFITIRVYAVTGRKKLIGLYLSCLVCAKAITGYLWISHMRANTVQLPDIPLDAFRTCTASGSFRLQLAPHAIGVVFDVSAFCTIIWVAYSNAVVIRFSSLLRTVVADATIYFIMVMVLQTLVLLFITFADPTISQFPLILHSVVTPILINRVVLSLKKTVDANGGVNRPWNTHHFTSLKFEPRSMARSSETRPSDDSTETQKDTNDIPLDDFVRNTRSLPPIKRLRMVS